MDPHSLYLAGADSAAVEAGFPVLSVASDSLLLLTVAAAAWAGRAHAVVASRQVDTHAVVPASVGLQAALIHVWKTQGSGFHDRTLKLVSPQLGGGGKLPLDIFQKQLCGTGLNFHLCGDPHGGNALPSPSLRTPKPNSNL